MSEQNKTCIAVSFYKRNFTENFNHFMENHKDYEFVSIVPISDFSYSVIFKH